jgi:hypothetical protein
MDDLYAGLMAELASGEMAIPVTMQLTLVRAAMSVWPTTHSTSPAG